MEEKEARGFTHASEEELKGPRRPAPAIANQPLTGTTIFGVPENFSIEAWRTDFPVAKVAVFGANTPTPPTLFVLGAPTPTRHRRQRVHRSNTTTKPCRAAGQSPNEEGDAQQQPMAYALPAAALASAAAPIMTSGPAAVSDALLFSAE